VIETPSWRITTPVIKGEETISSTYNTDLIRPLYNADHADFMKGTGTNAI